MPWSSRWTAGPSGPVIARPPRHPPAVFPIGRESNERWAPFPKVRRRAAASRRMTRARRLVRAGPRQVASPGGAGYDQAETTGCKYRAGLGPLCDDTPLARFAALRHRRAGHNARWGGVLGSVASVTGTAEGCAPPVSGRRRVRRRSRSQDGDRALRAGADGGAWWQSTGFRSRRGARPRHRGRLQHQPPGRRAHERQRTRGRRARCHHQHFLHRRLRVQIGQVARTAAKTAIAGMCLTKARDLDPLGLPGTGHRRRPDAQRPPPAPGRRAASGAQAADEHPSPAR